MSDNTYRGRGGGGRGDFGGRGGGRGGGDRGRGRGGGDGGRGRGGGDGGRGRGGGDGGRGRGGGDGGRGRGGGDGGHGRGRGDTQQMAYRGGPPRGGGRGGRGGGGPPGAIYLAGEPLPPPDARITAAEDELVKQTRGEIIDGFPGRRGYGTKGKQIVLRTNYFAITTAYEAKAPETALYRYQLEVKPEPSNPKKRRLLQYLMTHPSLKGMHFATDFASILVTTQKLDEAKLTAAWKKVTLPLENNAQPAPQQGQTPDFVTAARDRNTFDTTVVYKNSFNLREIIEYLRSKSKGATYQGSSDVIQMLNIILAKPANEDALVKNVGQNKFYPFGAPKMESYQLGGGLEALRGYFSSVRPAVGRLLLNLNVTAGAFFKPMPLVYLHGEFRGSGLDQFEAFIRRLKVEASYVKDGEKQAFMKKTKSIVGLAKGNKKIPVKRFGNAREVKFSFIDRSKPNAKSQEVTIADYFKRQHGITLKDPERPVLNVGTPDDPQYLPMELCNVLPGQAYRRLLNGDQTSEMLRFAARFPNLNGMSIAGTEQAPGPGLRLLRLADPAQPQIQRESVKPFGVSVGTSMITVPGRILVTPQVKYGKSTVTPRAGSWNSAGQKFIKPGKFNTWQVLIINREGGGRGKALIEDGSNDTSPPKKLIDEFTAFLKAYGIQMGVREPTKEVLLKPFTVNNREHNDKELIKFFAGAMGRRVDILLVIIPDVDKWLYARIKFHGDVVYGIGSVCAVGSKIQKSYNQGMYFGNLALKFNLKGGGISHSVANTVAPPIDNNTMIVGIDVTHPSPGSAKEAPSIACMVASVDPQMFQWPGSISPQTGKQEMVAELGKMMFERLTLWRKRNGRLPSKIVIYRDGVSEGQYQTVLLVELPLLEEAFDRLYGAKEKHPKVAIIIVGKRHHTRFYPTKVEDAHCDPSTGKGSWNPLPGTIVDRGITNKILREFYLQAHQGLQGTARPAHYVVIKDDISFEADQMEQFTHHLCYLFNRATKAVSICPPAYYADLLCERGRSYLFTALAEDNVSDSGKYDPNVWKGGVHARLSETTWYV